MKGGEVQALEPMVRKRADLSLKLLVFGISLLFLHEILKSLATIHMVISYTGYFTLFLSLFCALHERKLNFLNRKYANWALAVWFFAFFMLLYGFIQGYELRYISRDVWPFAYFSALLVASKKGNWKTLDRMIYVQFLAGLAVLLYIWPIYGMDFTRTKIQAINYSLEQPSLYFAWALLFAWPYMLLTYKEGSSNRKAVTIVGTGIFFLLALLFLKRMPFLRLCLFILLVLAAKAFSTFSKSYTGRSMSGISRKGLGRKLFTAALLAVTLLGGVWVFRLAQLVTGTSFISDFVERSYYYGSITEAVLRDDRFSRTPMLILEQMESYEILFGRGLGSTVWRTNTVNTTVESGLLSFFFKGGIINVILWYLGLLSCVGKWKNATQSRFQLLVLLYIILSPLSSVFLTYPATGYLMLYLGRSMARVGKSRDVYNNKDSGRSYPPILDAATRLETFAEPAKKCHVSILSEEN